MIFIYSSPMEEKVSCVFRVDKKRVPEIWDAGNGLIQRGVEYSKTENGISIDFTMDALASRFVVFKNKSSRKNDEGLNYNLQYGFKHSQKAGKNNITVEVINTWDNRIVGDIKNPNRKQYTNTNIKYKFKEDKPLLKSGLMGKAEIFF